jgi:pSer/pThr/pTyr-binding forkhead associated (FHA) protein
VTGPSLRLVLRGELAGGQPFEASTEVSARAINVEIGRGDADLAIDSGAVSRRHARLNGSSEALTLTDLGSSNGSAINGVPCLEGEVMYVEPGDTVILGDARFTVAIEPAAPGGVEP